MSAINTTVTSFFSQSESSQPTSSSESSSSTDGSTDSTSESASSGSTDATAEMSGGSTDPLEELRSSDPRMQREMLRAMVVSQIGTWSAAAAASAPELSRYEQPSPLVRSVDLLA